MFPKRSLASIVMIASFSIDVWVDDQAQSGPDRADQHPRFPEDVGTGSVVESRPPEVNAITIERCEPAGAGSSSPSFASRGAGCRIPSQAGSPKKSPGLAGLLSIGPTLGGLTIATVATAHDVNNGRTSDAGDIVVMTVPSRALYPIESTISGTMRTAADPVSSTSRNGMLPFGPEMLASTTIRSPDGSNVVSCLT